MSLTRAVNNIGIGLSASMAGLHLIPAAVSTLGCSILFLLIGNRMGRSRILRFIGDAADPISGLLLIGLGGALQIVQHILAVKAAEGGVAELMIHRGTSFNRRSV